MGKTRKKTGKGKAEKKTASLAVAKRILDILKSARSVQLEIDKLNIERLLIETYSDQNTEKAEDFQGELATNKRTIRTPTPFRSPAPPARGAARATSPRATSPASGRPRPCSAPRGSGTAPTRLYFHRA